MICKSASSAPHFLLARVQGYSFQLVIQLVFPAYTLQLPSVCVLPTAFKTFCWNKLGILTGTSWHFSDISSDISARWAHESTSLDVNKANGMLTSNATRIFCDNVTCFARSKNPAYTLASLYLCPADCFQDILFGGRVKVPHLISIRPMECWLATLDASSAIMSHALEQTNAARIRVSQNASSKLSASSLHGYSASIRKFQGFFWKGIFATLPIVLAVQVTIHTFPWKMRIEKCPLSFQYGILPGNSLDVYGQTCKKLEKGSKKQDAGMLTGKARRIFCDNVTCFGTNKCCSNRSHLQECFKWSARVLQVLLTSCLKACKGTAFNLFSNQSFPHTPYSFPLSVPFSLEQVGISPTYQVTYLLGGRMKVTHLMSIRPMECWLATLNASSATMSHALQEVKTPHTP